MFRRKDGTAGDAPPIEELNHLLDQLDEIIESTMDQHVESIRPPPPEPQRTSVLDSLKMRASKTWNNRVLQSSAAAAKDAESNSNPPSNKPSFYKEKQARFIAMDEATVEKTVETIRRIAELVVIGERSHAKQEDDPQAQEYLAIFETFFERQGLATMTNLLTGDCLQLANHPSIRKQKEIHEQQQEGQSSEAPPAGEEEDPARMRPVPLDEHTYMLLPPLAIATQAIQSVSILVQNVSRATSLFFILSNNHVNQLINFPLDQYHVAERFKHNQADNGLSPRRFASPELAELTTHFVTFLKSLALRMNAETLQFFLTYPPDMTTEEVEDIIVQDELHLDPSHDSHGDEMDDDRPMDENEHTVHLPPESPRPVSIKTVPLEFPLYERALEFCTAHQDSFVRVTAMNICLNTLRLATVLPDNNDDDQHQDTGKSPDGVLHNAKPLPLKERVSIAQYVCTPARVEKMTSPIFTKLAQLWGILEEQFREMDSSNASDMPKLSSGKVARVKEMARRQRYMDAFQDTAYNVQDELLLLEDVLKVGLTSLNEQVIEMMFATFVYPLLLQPLLLYFQRSPVPDEVLFADPIEALARGIPIPDSDLTATEQAMISAPVQSAFFCLSAAFRFLSNPPLLRLLFTSLFHPMAPEATGETMIRAKADVACLDPQGNVEIRIDPIDETTGVMKTSSDRSTYVFGTITGRRVVSASRSRAPEQDDTSCVFVLAPALAEILEFRGDDIALVARTRENPYRKAVFQCLRLCSQLSALRPMAVLAVEAAVSKFPRSFLAELLLGSDVERFKETNVPRTPVNTDAYLARLDDRGIGGGTTAGQSRLSLGTGGSALGRDFKEEVLSSFESCIIRAVPIARGMWKLEYDPVAVHALLRIISTDNVALQEAAVLMERRYKQTAGFLADIPDTMNRLGTESLATLLYGQLEATSLPKGSLIDCAFRGYGAKIQGSVVQQLLAWKDGQSGRSASISTLGVYSDLCSRSCPPSSSDTDSTEGAVRMIMASAGALVQTDALHNFLKRFVESKQGRSFCDDGDTLAGFALTPEGASVATIDKQRLYSCLSEGLEKAIFENVVGESGGIVSKEQGDVVSLIGYTAYPCVCEVPPSCAPLFSEASAKVVSLGITWQSLYLVLIQGFLFLVEPSRGSSGDGRIITKCSLANLLVERDPDDARTDTAARRVILSHDGIEHTAPGLFLFEEKPKEELEGPFRKCRTWRSALDVWFEDSKAVALAYEKVEHNTVQAKAARGLQIQRYLSQEW
eukprot:Nitzschia sp. Nitz4//scaffold166_size90379//82834//86722//NITZ4_005073-RA/size90379-augustus-gene-0.18-mRNA-1//-1//CDS//3329538244//1802//frame0